MDERFDDERLVALLHGIGERLETGADGSATPIHVGGIGRVATSRWLRTLAVAAGFALVLAGTVLVVPPWRHTVADWFGVGHTQITSVPVDERALVGLVPLVADARVVSEAEARARLGGGPPDLSDLSATVLGAPQVFVEPPEGGLILAWADASTTLWVHSGGADPEVLFDKLVDETNTVRHVDDLGESAVLIIGRHVVDTPQRRIDAGTVLLWITDGRELRLESDLPPDVMIEIARSL